MLLSQNEQFGLFLALNSRTIKGALTLCDNVNMSEDSMKRRYHVKIAALFVFIYNVV